MLGKHYHLKEVMRLREGGHNLDSATQCSMSLLTAESQSLRPLSQLSEI